MNYFVIPGMVTRHNKPNERVIIAAVERVFDMPYYDIIKKNRLRGRVWARYLFFYFMRLYTTKTLSELGEENGGFDHATVIHGLGKVKDLKEWDAEFKGLFQDCERIIGRLVKTGEGPNKTVLDFRTMNYHERKRYLHYLDEI